MNCTVHVTRPQAVPSNAPSAQQQEIIDRLGGDLKALESLVRSMVPNAHDADDVLQDVLLTICARPHVFLQHCEPMNLIRSIASSRTVDFFRKASIRRHLSIEGVEVESANDSAEAETCQETNGEVARLIEGTPDLDGGERQLLYARAEGLSLKEIGRRFFLQPGTVSSKLTRAYAKIRRWATNSRCLTVGKVS